MSNYDTPRRGHLLAEVRSRLETDLGPETRGYFEHVLEDIPTGSELFLGALEDYLAMAPERLERQLANAYRNLRGS